MNYIEYNGKNIPVKFSYRVLKNIKNQFGVDLVLNDDNLREWFDKFEHQENLYFEMIKEGFKQAKTECTVSLEDMEDILSVDGMYADMLQIYSKDAVIFMTPKKKLLEVTAEEVN